MSRTLAIEWAPYARAGVYLLLTFVVARVLDWLLARHYKVSTRMVGRPLTAAESSRIRVIRRLVVAAVLFVGIALALVQIPTVNSLARGMIASAGITALVVGLASRSILANFVSGLIIAFSQPVRIGDLIAIDGDAGFVEEIHLTYTYIRASDNRRVLIPNEQLTSKVIHNYSLVDPTSSAHFEFEVPLTSPTAQVCGAVLDELRQLENRVPDREPSLELKAATVDALRFRVTVWDKSKPAADAFAADTQESIVERLQTTGFLGQASEAAGP
jgi:small-conductance mechanosensitive channel